MSHQQLDNRVDDAVLRELFNLVGTVITAEIAKDKEGKSLGFGVVVMDNPIGAFQVIYFNQTNL